MKRIGLNILTRIALMLTFMSTSNASESFKFLTVVDPLKMEEAYSVDRNSSINPGQNLNNLYQQIYEELHLEYENIGRREAARVLSNNQSSVSGGLNSIGFSYRRPFLDFGLTLDRNLAPDLFDDERWIVTDTFSVHVDASRILSNLKDEGAIDISENNLALFAGIVFKRTFTWVHYAASYNEGLMKDFDKLFFPFKALQFNSVVNMKANEMIFKEDSLSLKAGEIVSAPLYSGITGSAGVLAKFEKLSRVEVISSEKNNVIDIGINFEKAKSVFVGAGVQIQADFLKLLRLTLFSYDFNYELESSYKIYLKIAQNNLRELNLSHPVAMEIQQILSQREGDLDILSPYLISEEKKISQALQHRYSFLLLGGVKSSKTQQVEISKEGNVKTFFRHYYEKIRYTEDLLSRLFASVIYSIVKTDIGATKFISDLKRVTIEYDSQKNLIDQKDFLDIGSSLANEQKLSLTFASEFKTQRLKGSDEKKNRAKVKYMLDRFSGVDPQALKMIDKGELNGPYFVTGKYQVNVDGLRYFNDQSVDVVFDYLDNLCDEYPKNSFVNFRNVFDTCRRSLQNDYVDYLKDLTHDRVSGEEIKTCEQKAKKFIFSSSKKRMYLKNCLAALNEKNRSEWVNIPLWQLKNLTQNIVENCHSKVHYYNLFGLQNVFFYGQFDAKSKNLEAFTTHYHEGAFKGLGAVDHFMRVENIRSPSSVVVDQ